MHKLMYIIFTIDNTVTDYSNLNKLNDSNTNKQRWLGEKDFGL